MGVFLDPTDLDPFATIEFAKAAAMIEDAEADAMLAAPCITDEDFDPIKAKAVKSILRQAVLRWNDAGSGAVQTQSAGPFGVTVDNRQERRGMFWPSEIVRLQNLCSDNQGGAYTLSLAGPDPDPALTLDWM